MKISLLLLAAAAAVAVADRTDHKTQDLWDVLDASKRILDYYKAHMTDVNIDAVIGTRMAEGQYTVLMESLDSSAIAPRDDEAVEVLRLLLADIRTFNTNATNFIRNEYGSNIESIGILLEQSFWEIPLTSLHLDSSSISYKEFDKKVLQGIEQIYGDQSDDCLTEVTAGEESNVQIHSKQEHQRFKRNTQHNGNDTEKCLISENCLRTMTQAGFSGYSLTHQLFYLIIAMQAGCIDQINDRIANIGGKPLEEITRELCTKILMEAHTIAEAGYPELRKDLFMEQGLFCGQLGYTNFFPRLWVRNVLSWQRDIGCYGDFLLDEELKKQLHAHNRTEHEEKSESGNKRTKRNEKSMPGDCMAHQSSVAIGYLAVSLRTLIVQ